MGLRTIVSITIAALLLHFSARAGERESPPPLTLHFFWGEGCPTCAREKLFLEGLQERYPQIRIESYEVMQHREYVDLLIKMATECGVEARGVPTLFVGRQVFCGFSEDIARQIEQAVQAALGAPQAPLPGVTERLTIPLLGAVDTLTLSLPVFTLIIAGLDSFNPCAFFVLLFLLSLLIHAHSRRRMLLIGGVFVLSSGLVYFLFMAAWLNLFLLIGHLPAITIGAGSIALLVAALNIKEFFLFKQGVSLTIPERAKPRLFQRMRELLRAGSIPAMLAGTVVLATAANSYELLCTAGFPMVFTRVLTLRNLPSAGYYLYLALYNLVYIIPLAVIVIIFAITLGSRKLSEWQGRVLKLASGSMMLCLGMVLLIDPTLLTNAAVSVILLVGALGATWLIVIITRRLHPEWSRR